MSEKELSISGKQEGANPQRKQLIERDPQGRIIKIKDSYYGREYQYLYSNTGDLDGYLQAIGIGNVGIGCATRYKHIPSTNNREIVLEIKSFGLETADQPKDMRPIRFCNISIWVPEQAGKSRPELIEDESGEVNPLPVIRNAYKTEYRILDIIGSGKKKGFYRLGRDLDDIKHFDDSGKAIQDEEAEAIRFNSQPEMKSRKDPKAIFIRQQFPPYIFTIKLL